MVFLGACEESSVDSSAPLVQINAPFDGAEYRSGEILPVELILTDNVDLSTLVLKVHDNERAHDENLPSNFFHWDTMLNLNVFGVETRLQFDFPIPEDLPVETNFHLIVDCGDKSGNFSGWQERNFTIRRGCPRNIPDNAAPTIDLQSNASVATFTNTPIIVLADVEDDLCLKSLDLQLVSPSDSVWYEKTYSYNDINGPSFQLQESLNAPSVKDNYILNIKATDGLDNVSSVDVAVQVL